MNQIAMKNVRQFPQDYFLYNIAVCQKLHCKLQEKLSDVTWPVHMRNILRALHGGQPYMGASLSFSLCADSFRD